MLMDEPLSNLDAKLRNQMRAEIIKLRQRIDTTFVYVTHDQTEAMTLGDRIVIMKGGVVQQIDTPKEVFDSPRNLFVAGFIGTPQMNFFNGILEGDADGFAVTCMDKKIRLTDGQCSKLKGTITGRKNVTVGVRSEHIEIMPSNDESGIAAAAEVCELMGSEIYIYAAHKGNGTGDTDQNIVMRVSTMDLPEEYSEGIPYGMNLRFSFKAQMLHLFDSDSEESLLWR